MFCVGVHRRLQSLRAPPPNLAELKLHAIGTWSECCGHLEEQQQLWTPLTADPEHLSQFSIYLGEVRIERGLSLHGHGCAGTHFVDHTDLKLTAWLPHLDRFPFLRSKFYFMDSVSGEVFFKRSFTTKIDVSHSVHRICILFSSTPNWLFPLFDTLIRCQFNWVENSLGDNKVQL